MSELVAATAGRANRLQATGRLHGEQLPYNLTRPGSGPGCQTHQRRQILDRQRSTRGGEQPEHVRGESGLVTALQVGDLLPGQCGQSLSLTLSGILVAAWLS